MDQIQQSAFTARVHGVVQGVGFRYSTRERARRLGISGYVRNMYDGTVEVMAEGDARKLASLLAWLKTGPPGAYVERVDSHPVTFRGIYKNFNIEF
ncbi:MAG: acylphosphatase [Candidatus Lokiarchaeota archaeon]|jgi:acylphosphatase